MQAEPVHPFRFSFYVPDNWNYNASNPCLHRGGNYSQYLSYGMFRVHYDSASSAYAYGGCRHLVQRALLPDLTMFSTHEWIGTPR